MNLAIPSLLNQSDYMYAFESSVRLETQANAE